ETFTALPILFFSLLCGRLCPAETVVVYSFRRRNENAAGFNLSGCRNYRRHASEPSGHGVRLYDSRRLVAPIAVAQEPLVEFAGWQPRQLRLPIDRPAPPRPPPPLS